MSTDFLTKVPRLYNEKRTLSSKNVTENTGYPHAKKEIKLLSYSTHKNKLKMDEIFKQD